MFNLVDYINETLQDDNKLLNFLSLQLYRDFIPDINGYTLIFMTPPDLSGYRSGEVDKKSNKNAEWDPDNESSFIYETGSKLLTFAATDFTPPQEQVNTDQISSRSGAIPFATEVTTSETVSVTYMDNINLDIYTMHQLWLRYIREVLEGIVAPSSEYYDDNSDLYGAIDYCSSFYIVKYMPNMKDITFAAKCTGVFPQSLPNKEVIGQRTTNDLTVYSINYFCSDYKEITWRSKNNWILSELTQIMSKFAK